MAKRIPTLGIWRIYVVAVFPQYKCLIPQTDIFPQFQIPFSQSISPNSMGSQYSLNFDSHFKPKIFRMLIRKRYLVLSCKGTILKLFTILNNIYGNLTSNLGIDRLFQIYSLHSSPAFHFDKKPNNKIPSFPQILMLHRNVKFPIRDTMLKLVLCMPVHPRFQGIKFYEPIIAQALVAILIRYLVAMGLEIFVTEDLGHCEQIFIILGFGQLGVFLGFYG